MIPRATYRIQFHHAFRFDAAVPLAPYLADLGISHLYASPIATARAGSNHGYDVVDPRHINPELGGEAGFRTLAAALRAHGIGIVLDIVPNHMAVGGNDNAWWLDVLQHGPDSAFAGHFDIDWTPADPALHGRLLAPFLGLPYADALAQGAVRLDRAADGTVHVLAHDTHRFPLRHDDAARLAADTDPAARHDGRTAEGFARLHALLERQHYRLAHWRTAGDAINWRRFFDITELAGLRIEDPRVFDAVHALPLRLYAEGLIDGVRVDHVDGLADPAGYGRRLRAAFDAAAAHRPADAAAGTAWIVVEKILAAGERLDPAWATDGTSGYDFMNDVSAFQHDPAGAAPLAAHWHALSGRPADFAAEERAARAETLTRSFAGQHDAAVAAFHRWTQDDLATRDITSGMLRRAMTALLIELPCYRSYGAHAAAPLPHDPLFAAALVRARVATPPGEAAVLDLLADALTGRAGCDAPLRRDAVRRFEQLSAPLSAKSVEDTAFYRHARLLSRTDVGFDPACFALDAAGFAARVAERTRTHPHAMLATATHDHKRGEDVRARLAVLSELPDRWITLSAGWQDRYGDPAIDPADGYAIFQTLVGACPVPFPDNALSALAERVADWQRKALREAKLRSSWVEPDTAYEDACTHFIARLLADRDGFVRELCTFVTAIAPAAALNGIVQAVLRCTLPGVPDCYQGTEFWDWSLVDPDNRRPVDYAARMAGLVTTPEPHAALDNWQDGRIKQQAIATALRLRRAHPALFAAGSFDPLAVSGPHAGHLFAFLRRHEGQAMLVAVPRLIAAGLDGATRPVVPDAWWGDGRIQLPSGKTPSIAETLGGLPFAIRLL